MPFEPSHINDWIVLVGSISAILGGAWILIRRAIKYVRDMDGIHVQRTKFLAHFGEEYADAIHEILTDLAADNDIAHARHGIFLRRLKIGIYVCDAATGECIYADGMEEIFGVASDSLLGLGWSSAIEEREKHVAKWEWCVKHKVSYRDKYTVRHAATQRLIQCRTEAFLTNGGQPRYVGYVEVISEPNKP